MASLDLHYISSVVLAAKNDDPNAFAELFAATCDRMYALACHLTGDRDAAATALQETYIRAKKELTRLQEPSLFLTWLSRLCLRSCLKAAASTGSDPFSACLVLNGREYTLRRIFDLPLTEGQTILFTKHCRMSMVSVSRLLEISISDVRRQRKNGIMRLEALERQKIGGEK